MPFATKVAFQIGYIGAFICVKKVAIIAGLLVGTVMVLATDNPFWVNVISALAAAFGLETLGFVFRVIGGTAQVRWMRSMIEREENKRLRQEKEITG
jgi:hypothetical protein